jgi:thiaminase
MPIKDSRQTCYSSWLLHLLTLLRASPLKFDHLTQVGADPSSSCAEVLAAMAPCMRLYAFLGATLARAFPVDNSSSSSVSSTYRGWIDTYASSEFEAAASTVEQLLEQYSSDSSSSSSGSTDEYSMLLHNYRLAMALEFSFFDACGEEAGLQGDPAALEVSAVLFMA